MGERTYVTNEGETTGGLALNLFLTERECRGFHPPPPVPRLKVFVRARARAYLCTCTSARGSQEAALNYFHRSACQAHRPAVRLRNLSLSDGRGYRAQATAAAAGSWHGSFFVLPAAAVPVNRRTPPTVANGISHAKYCTAIFPSSIPPRRLFPMAETGNDRASSSRLAFCFLGRAESSPSASARARAIDRTD